MEKTSLSKSKRKIAVKKPKEQPAPSLKMYRRIAVSFVVVTCLLLVFVVYLSFVEAIVRIKPTVQTVQASAVLDIVKSPLSSEEVAGVVTSAVFEQAKSFTLEGEDGQLVEAKAGGIVEIFNTHTVDQTLVATTRLLSPEGILFRIDETVVVPVGGSVTVTAHADESGKGGEISPTTFTIPGLSETLQKKIYAQNAAAFTGGEVTIQTLTLEKLDELAVTLEAEILEIVKEKLREQNSSFSQESFSYEVLEKKSDVEPGTETGQVTILIRLRATGVFFDGQAAWDQLREALVAEIPGDMELQAVDSSGMSATILSADTEDGLAVVEVAVTAPAIISSRHEILSASGLVGKSVAEVKRSLEAYDLIDSVDVRVTPFWLKRMPSLEDHIRLEIE